MKSLRSLLQIAVSTLYIVTACAAFAQDSSKIISKTVTLQFISPADLVDANIVRSESIATDAGVVTVKTNSSANEVLLFGNQTALEQASRMIEFLDVLPKQIVVEVRIIEVDNQKLRQTGIDWQQILSRTSIPFQYIYNRNKDNFTTDNNATQGNTGVPPNANYSHSSTDNSDKSGRTTFGLANSMTIGDFLNLLESSGGTKVLNTPKIVTINNRKGTILDGSRILYVDKYASYSNLFQTQELKTGLFLSVTPTLGSSGYIKMNVEAKLTNLNNVNNDLRPIEVGQMVENVVVVKAGESIILGGLKKTSTQKVENSVPILGSILPFIFSSTKNVEVTNDVLLVLTPTVVDLAKMEIPDLLNEKVNK